MRQSPFLCAGVNLALQSLGDEGDKYQILSAAVFNAVAFTVWAEGSCASTKLHIAAVVTVQSLTLQDMVGFSVAVVLVIANRAARWDDNLGEHIIAAELFLAQKMVDSDFTLAVSLVCCFHRIYSNYCHNKIAPFSFLYIMFVWTLFVKYTIIRHNSTQAVKNPAFVISFYDFGAFIGGQDSMIYLLKFGASFVLPPGIFIACFALIGVYLWRRREKKTALGLWTVTAVFYLLSTGWVSGMLMSSLESTYEQPVSPQGDAIIMLGGGATADTPNQGERGNLTSDPAGRLLTVAELYNRLNVPVLVSGGRVYADSGAEAELAKRELMRLGVPEKMIIAEPNSLNTRQNAMYSGELLRERGLTKPILVTSAYHMSRSVLNFEKEGFEVVPFPTNYYASREQAFHYNRLAPTADALQQTTRVMMERLRFVVTKYIE